MPKKLFECEVCKVASPRWRRCDLHYFCDDCERGPGEVSLCFYSEGVLCDLCHKARVEERIRAFGVQEEVLSANQIQCPFCGHLIMDSWELSDYGSRGGETECPDCESEFRFTVYYTDVYYKSYRIERAEEPVPVS